LKNQKKFYKKKLFKKKKKKKKKKKIKVSTYSSYITNPQPKTIPRRRISNKKPI